MQLIIYTRYTQQVHRYTTRNVLGSESTNRGKYNIVQFWEIPEKNPGARS